MPNQQPVILAADGRRRFAGSAAAVTAFIVDEHERVLMLAHPQRPDQWEIVNGALDAGETVVEGVLREVYEEAGPQVQVRPLATVHTYTFRYDDNVQYMISLAWVLAYDGGPVIPGSDMTGSAVRWVSVDEVERGDLYVLVPRYLPWMFRRAVELYRTLKDRPPDELQPPLAAMTRNKYGPS